MPDTEVSAEPAFLVPGIPGDRTAGKLSGTFEYLTDRLFDDCLWAAVVRSPYPHAEAIQIDCGQLLERAGVVAVLDWRDVPGKRFNPALVPACGIIDASADKLLLTQFPRHVGDGVAVVVAATREQARLAAAEAAVTWRLREPILTMDEALGASRVLGRLTDGDPRALALVAGAPVVVRDRFEFAAAQHNCLEPHSCAALVGPDISGVEIWSNTQCPAEVLRLVSAITGIPGSELRVRKVDEGGGFGGKQDLYEEALLAWLALKLGRSVRLTYSRAEELCASRVRGAGRIDLALGFDLDGRLLASDMEAVLDSGAYASHTPHVLSCLSGHARVLYPRALHCYRGTAVHTNTIPAGAYRGYGFAEANFAFEQVMDEAAERLTLDPVELRLRNLARDRDGRGAAECLRMLSESPREPVLPAAAQVRRGRGVAVAAKHSVTTTDCSDESTASVALYPGPRIVLTTGTCDSGTGSSRALASIVSSEMGVPTECVLLREGDTALGVCDVGSTAQRSVFIGGEAARHAARQARMQILRAGGGQPGELMLSWPYLVDREGRRVADLGTLAAEHPEGTIGGSATARVPGPGASYCALAADVSVDTETGQVRVDRVTAAVDCGRVVDPAGARGQVIGGIVQGVGLACLDEWVPDPDGRGPATILEHGAPSAGDAPALTVLFREADPGCQATGLGELPIVPVAAAVANAVAAATGVRFKAAPLRPAAVWRRLQETARAQQ